MAPVDICCPMHSWWKASGKAVKYLTIVNGKYRWTVLNLVTADDASRRRHEQAGQRVVLDLINMLKALPIDIATALMKQGM